MIEVRPATKISVCTDLACEEQGAYETIDELRCAGIRVNEIGCPGRCGSGPVVEVESSDGGFDYIEFATRDSDEVAQLKAAGG